MIDHIQDVSPGSIQGPQLAGNVSASLLHAYISTTVHYCAASAAQTVFSISASVVSSPGFAQVFVKQDSPLCAQQCFPRRIALQLHIACAHITLQRCGVGLIDMKSDHLMAPGACSLLCCLQEGCGHPSAPVWDVHSHAGNVCIAFICGRPQRSQDVLHMRQVGLTCKVKRPCQFSAPGQEQSLFRHTVGCWQSQSTCENNRDQRDQVQEGTLACLVKAQQSTGRHALQCTDVTARE